MKNRKPFLIVLAVVAILAMYAGIGRYIYLKSAWKAPEYESTKVKTLLSNRVDRLTKQQEDAFWRDARWIANKELDFDDGIDSDSLYVEKTKIKHMYSIRYTCEGKIDGEKTSYDTSFDYVPQKSLKDGEFRYYLFTAKENDQEE
ncbi:hypothetical protein AB9M75_03140 [Lactobacillus sp. AN1001]